jgi:hypothetical protein
MNETLLLNLYNKYNLSSKGDFNTFKNDMANPTVRQNFFNKYNLASKGNYQIFESDLLGTNKNLNQTPTQQQTVAPKPVVKQEEEQTAFSKATDKVSNYLSNLFGSSEDLTQKVNNNLTENKSNLKNIKEPTKPTEEITQFGKTGYKPGSSFFEKTEFINNEYKKIKDKYEALAILQAKLNKEGKPDIKLLHPSIQANYLKEIKPLQTKYQTELNIFKANPTGENVKVDENIKQIKTAQITSNLANVNNKLKETKEKSFLDFIPEDTNLSFTGVLNDAFNPLSHLYNAYKGYNIKQDAIKNLENQLNIGKKDLEYLNKYNLDIEQTLQNASPEKRIQMEMALNPELKGLAESAKKYAGRKDKTYIRDILNNPFFGKEVTINNLTSETNEKNFYEKLNNVAKSRTDFYTSNSKDKLQKELIQNKLDNIFNVNSIEFNSLVENYDQVIQNPNLIFQIYPDKNPQEVLNKLTVLNKNPEFQKIINTEKYFNQINDERVDNNLKQFTKEKVADLKNLNYLETLGKSQQQKEDYIEQQAMKDGIFSLANAKFLGTQLLESGDFLTNTGKSFAGTLAGLATGDKFEATRKLQAKADVFKAINFPQDESELSLFANSKWIVVPTKDGSNYQIAVNDQGNFLTARSHNLSLPVNDPQKLKEIQDFYEQNKQDLLKNTKNLSEIDGGYSAMAGYIGSQVATGALEEVPSFALEAALAAGSEGLGSALLVKRLAKWSDKINDINKAKDRYDKVSRLAINGLSTYAEIGYGVRKNYEERGLDPSFYNTLITSGALTAVAQLTPALENTYQRFGSQLAGKEFKEEVNNLLIKDMPDVIKTLSGATANIVDKNKRDFILNKELRNYVVERVAGIAGKVGKKFGKEGVQEAAEETIFEPIAQVFANAANAGLTGNDLYNKETLRDLGFLDPETALIAGLTGGVMASGVTEITDLMRDKENAFNSINNLQAAINNPNKFKAYLSTYLNNQNDEPNKNLNQEQYNNIINNFDTIANNYNATKESYGFNNDFVSKFNLNNPTQEKLFKNIGLTKDNITNFNGEKTLNNLILENEVNKITGFKVAEELTNNIGLNINGQKTLQPLLDNNGMVSLQKLQELTGQKEFDQDTLNSIRTYNTNVAKDLRIKNALNLFNQNFSTIQNKFVNNYQQTLLSNPDLASPELGLYDNAYQDKLFNKLINDKRIDDITNQLALGTETLENSQLKKELNTLITENKELEKGLNKITNTYKEGFLDTQNEINTLSDNFNTVNNTVSQYLTDYFSGDINDFLDLDLEDINKLDDEAANKLNDLIEDKNKKLKELKTAFNKANKKYNNAIFSSTLNNNNILDLEESIKKDKEILNKIKEHRKLYIKLRKGKISSDELLELKNNNSKYNEETIKNNVLPYFINFNKDEIINKFNEDPDLLLSMFSILEEMGYVGDIQNYKNINLDTLNSIVTDGIIKLNYNISLINNNQENLINNFDQKNGALLINSYIQNIEETSIKNQEQPIIETPTQLSDNVQDNVISLIEKNSKLKSDFDEDEITNNFYIINDKEYKRVTSVERDDLNSNEYLTAGANVGNFFDSLGRFIFGNLNVTKENSDVILQAQLDYFKNNGITFNLKKDSYVEMFNNLIEQRDSLIQEGFKFITEERVLYHAYDGLKFIGEDSTGINDNTIGVAGTMDIIAVGKDGKIDIIDLKTISDNTKKTNENLRDKETNGWSKQLGFYKTLLEKIPSVKVNNTKVFVSKVKYDISDFGNTISFLNFIEPKLNTINISKSALTLINNYLSIPNLVIDKPVEIITNTEAITEEEMPDYILEQQMLLAEDSNPELPNNEDFGPDEFQLSQATGVPIIEIEGITIVSNLETKPTTDAKTDIERRRQEELDTKTTAGYGVIASDYLFTGGRGVILSTDYLLQALTSSFEYAGKQIDTIRNKYAAELGNIKDDIGTEVYNKMMQEIKAVISNTYQNKKAEDLFDKILNNATGFISREGNQVSSSLDVLNESQKNKINAKYDAELAALEGQTPTEFEVEPTAEESARAKSVFGTKPVLDPVTQLITGQANQVNFETSSNNVLEGFEDEADSNIVSLTRVAYVKFNITYDEQNNKQYDVSIFNNQELNKKFNNKILTETEVEKLFKDNGLFFSNKIESNNVYVLKDINKKPINSFQQENIISKITIPESSILNSIYANDLTNQEGEIVVLDTENKYNNTLKTEKDFRNNAALGVVVNNALVAIIPANKGNTRNAQVRNKLTITKVGNTFTVQPFKVKIKKVKKDAFLFNNQPIRINNFLNKVNGFKSTIAFVYEIDKVKKLVNPFVNREVSELNIPADNLTNNGVFLILEKSGENPIIIPLQTPKLREFFEGTQEDLENIKTILKTSISDVFTSQDLQGNYNVFLNRLRTASDKNPIISQIFKIIPTSINETSTNTSQKIKLENLKLNFNLDNIMDYLWDTLITLNENTRDFYSVDLDPENFYANNSVIIDYDKNIIMDTKNNDITSNSIFNQDNDVYC